ncbi:MAG: tetratricopeptide repeat protein [Acidobacteria bacterium]|nr:tetratricopeptide repeat protein [Acidobacteriota bacterium]
MLTKFLEKNYQKFFWILPALLAFCCFINTLGFDFVYDDLFIIVKAAPTLEDWSINNLKRLFTSDVWTFLTQSFNETEKNDSVYYRPFFNLFLMINYLYAGVNPIGWHLTSILLHILNTILVYHVVLASLKQLKQLKISKNERSLAWIALISSSIFAIHPVQTESVAWVSAYVNALLAILIFSSLLAYFQARNSEKNQKILWLLISVGFYSLALLTKETALVLALLLFFYEMLFFDRDQTWSKRLINDLLMGLPFFLVTVFYFVLRIKIVGAINPGVLNPDFPEITAISPSVGILTLPNIVLNYLKILIFPFSLSPLYPINYVREAELVNFYLPLVILSIIAILIIILSWRSLVLRLGFIWLFIPLLPVLDIRAFKPEDLMHDRYLYFSLIGAGIVLAQGIEALNKFLAKDGKENDKEPLIIRTSLLVVIGIYFIVLIATTIKQNYVWADEWQLWTASREGFPTSCMANKELGRLSIIAKKDTQAIDYYEQAKLACPNSADVYLQLGALYGRTGNLNQAEIEFKKMITLAPYPFLQAEGYFNLGLVYQLKGDKAQAIAYYEKALDLDPKSEKTIKALQKIKTS